MNKGGKSRAPMLRANQTTSINSSLVQHTCTIILTQTMDSLITSLLQTISTTLKYPSPSLAHVITRTIGNMHVKKSKSKSNIAIDYIPILSLANPPPSIHPSRPLPFHCAVHIFQHIFQHPIHSFQASQLRLYLHEPPRKKRRRQETKCAL
jgi:hypothetical protein